MFRSGKVPSSSNKDTELYKTTKSNHRSFDGGGAGKGDRKKHQTQDSPPCTSDSQGHSMQLGLKASIKAREKAMSKKEKGGMSPVGGGRVEVDDATFDFYVSNEFADETDSCTCSVCQRARDGLSPMSRPYLTLEVVEWVGDLTAATSRIFFTFFWICASIVHTLRSYDIQATPVAAVQAVCWQVSETFFIVASFFYCYLSYLEWVSCDRVRFLYSFGIIYMMASTSNFLVKLEHQRWLRTIDKGMEAVNEYLAGGWWFMQDQATNGTAAIT
eukprot:jgi/Bigna1/91696/estExt_fgenesh1_pg.C_1140007